MPPHHPPLHMHKRTRSCEYVTARQGAPVGCGALRHHSEPLTVAQESRWRD
jgi:hypothetical protein